MHRSHFWLLVLWLGFISGGAWAQEQAYTRIPAVVYVAPDDQSQAVVQLGLNTPVWLYGCDQERAWCQVSWGNVSGWVESEVLIQLQPATPTYVQSYDPGVVPIIVINQGSGYPHHPGGWGAHAPQPWSPGPPHPTPVPPGPQPGQKGYTGRPPGSP